MTSAITRPEPNIDRDIEPFWQRVERHQLSVMRCTVCGAHYWPAAYCRNHENKPFFGDMEWVPASGRGTVFAFNVHHWAFDAMFKDEIPYVFALIELEEGPLFGSNVVDCDPADVQVGMPVQVVFRECENDGRTFTLPLFVPLADPTSQER